MPKTPLSFYLHIIAVAVVVFAVGSYLSSRTPDRAEGSPSIISGDSSAAPRNDNRESAYDRVMRTGVIRCGYVVWPPLLTKDVNTGRLSGLHFEITEAIGKRLNLKIEWSQELNFSTYLADLSANKYDLECSGGWPTADRGKLANYTTPYAYITYAAYSKYGNDRFAENISIANSPKARIAVIDGENSAMLAKEKFPLAQILSSPQNTLPQQLFLEIASGKADITFTDVMSGEQFMEKNPNTIQMASKNYLKVIPQNFTVAFGEEKMLAMLNTAIQELNNSGTSQHIISNTVPFNNAVLPVATPYQLPANKN